MYNKKVKRFQESYIPTCWNHIQVKFEWMIFEKNLLPLPKMKFLVGCIRHIRIDYFHTLFCSKFFQTPRSFKFVSLNNSALVLSSYQSQYPESSSRWWILTHNPVNQAKYGIHRSPWQIMSPNTLNPTINGEFWPRIMLIKKNRAPNGYLGNVEFIYFFY